MTRRAVAVLTAGALTTVQDRGRPGLAHLGVPRAGALDRRAADLANRLVGNDATAAVLETTLDGVAFRVSTAMTIAVTGAPALVVVDGRHRGWAEPVSVRAGQRVLVGPAQRGVRSYVAFAGGVDVSPVLGSRSTDTLAWVGPPQVRDGDLLPIGSLMAAPGPVDVTAPRVGPGPVLLSIALGPRDDWFTGAARRTLTGSAYAVAPDSNRVALRLQGRRLHRRDAAQDELPSEGIVLGAVQVPPSGQPLVFLNDHPTTGGYPVIGVVAGADLDACAQLRPGDELWFVGSDTGR